MDESKKTTEETLREAEMLKLKETKGFVAEAKARWHRKLAVAAETLGQALSEVASAPEAEQNRARLILSLEAAKYERMAASFEYAVPIDILTRELDSLRRDVVLVAVTLAKHVREAHQ